MAFLMGGGGGPLGPSPPEWLEFAFSVGPEPAVVAINTGPTSARGQTIRGFCLRQMQMVTRQTVKNND